MTTAARARIQAPAQDHKATSALPIDISIGLPAHAVSRLKAAGLGAVRVPVGHGGHGATIPELTQLWIELATVDANLPQVVADLILRATSDLFDTLGASATSRTLGLDRHGRNARTASSHNPRILKSRVVGAHLVFGGQRVAS